jgi:hypothetical protein
MTTASRDICLLSGVEDVGGHVHSDFDDERDVDAELTGVE